VVSALPNPGGRAFITETGTAAAAINILTTGANVNPGNGFLSTTNEYVSVGYVEGTPRPWNVLQMGGASVRSITWDLYVSSVDVSPDISGGTHPDGYYGTNSRDLSVTLANLRNSGELSAYISSFPLETCAALVCVEPTATVAPNAGSCVSGQVANNATMALSAVVNGDEAGISLGATYTGAAYSDAAHIDVTSGSGTFTGLAHGTTYTIRVYNMDDACFTDYTVSTPTLTLPSVTLNDPADVCIDGADMNFIATPAGGVFTTTAAVGFTSNGAAGTATLDVSAAGAGTYDVTYTYTDANGCDASQTVSVTVSPEPMVGCPTDRSVCLGGAPIALMGGTPAGGTYSGTGVGGGLFDPVLAGVGTHTITYTYLDGNGCEASCSFLITVLRVDCGTFPWGGN
jgi:hypothetical protein